MQPGDGGPGRPTKKRKGPIPAAAGSLQQALAAEAAEIAGKQSPAIPSTSSGNVYSLQPASQPSRPTPGRSNPLASLSGLAVLSAAASSKRCDLCEKVAEHPYQVECGHQFCFVCICQWFVLTNVCPTCQHEINQPQPTVEFQALPTYEFTDIELTQGSFLSACQAVPCVYYFRPKASDINVYSEHLPNFIVRSGEEVIVNCKLYLPPASAQRGNDWPINIIEKLKSLNTQIGETWGSNAKARYPRIV